jgi:hypothetical protein
MSSSVIIPISSTPIKYPDILPSDYSESVSDEINKQHVLYVIHEYIEQNKITDIKRDILYNLVSYLITSNKDFPTVNDYDTSKRMPSYSTIVKIGKTEYVVWKNNSKSYSIYGSNIPVYSIFVWNGDNNIFNVLYSLFI